jgi:hypothetical protein
MDAAGRTGVSTVSGVIWLTDCMMWELPILLIERDLRCRYLTRMWVKGLYRAD